ncbi:MAG: helix-turn-helix domain-containing protein [Nitrosomonas sp.]|uniref:helix-turn-helix domain-containing protein n=1 Tax=Nitrosomonas sp. TaxID=42353 RepID=UPI00272F233F|nr:helix-turn-helix domain-containing protein [Nitrosomonas sp.]MDP1549425.1 helix-turn-helix domain-containing protein [Nitrosomonas sp.]
MEMKNYIERAEKKAGKQIELAKMLGISDAYIRMVKSGKRGFPDDICIQIADYIGADRLEVIAASNLVTEKDEKKRRIFESCFTRAASVTAAAVVISIMTLPIQKPVNAGNLNGQFTNVQIIGN